MEEELCWGRNQAVWPLKDSVVVRIIVQSRTIVEDLVRVDVKQHLCIACRVEAHAVEREVPDHVVLKRHSCQVIQQSGPVGDRRWS